MNADMFSGMYAAIVNGSGLAVIGPLPFVFRIRCAVFVAFLYAMLSSELALSVPVSRNLIFLFFLGPNDAHKSLGDIKIPDKDKKDKKKILKLNSICTHLSRCDLLACGTSSGLVTMQVG